MNYAFLNGSSAQWFILLDVYQQVYITNQRLGFKPNYSN